MNDLLYQLPIHQSGKSGWPWTQDRVLAPDKSLDSSPWPRVSIVTPSYNQARFLEETIRSVLLQGYPNLEYIIMDGGSTDGSVEIIRKYEPWLAYWVSEKDGGQADAIDKGWRMATGDVVAWLNSDDTYVPGAVGKAMALLAAHPSASVIAGSTAFVGEDGVPIRVITPSVFDPHVHLILPPYAQPGVFCRRSAVEATGFLDTTLHYVMDHDLWYRLGLAGYGTVCTSEVFATGRQWAEAKTSNKYLAFGLEALRLVDKITALPDASVEIIRAAHHASAAMTLRMALFYYLVGDVGRAEDFCRNAAGKRIRLADLLPFISAISEVLLDQGLDRLQVNAESFAHNLARNEALPVDSSASQFASELQASAHVVGAWRAQGEGNLSAVRRHVLHAWQLSAFQRKQRGSFALLWRSVMPSKSDITTQH